MKFYENPQITVELLYAEDIVTASIPDLENGLFGENEEVSESFGKYFPN